MAVSFEHAAFGLSPLDRGLLKRLVRLRIIEQQIFSLSRTVADAGTRALIALCASNAPIIALINSDLRSGELVRGSVVLLVACARSVADSRSLPFSTLLT
jgi:hypothetical protein